MAKPAPEPLVILQDHREGLPWKWSDACRVEIVHLPTADYSMGNGWSGRVACERKSLPDLINSLTTARRDVFLDVCRRMQAYEHRLLVVEADIADVLAHRYVSRANASSIVGSTVALFHDYGLASAWWHDARTAADLVERWFRRIVVKAAVHAA